MNPTILRLLAAAARQPNTLSFVASATSTTSTVRIPSSARAGDVAVLFDRAWNNQSPPSTVVPSGWTSIRNDPGTVSRNILSAKVLVSGDPNALITGMDGVFGDRKIMLVFRANVAATGFVTGSSNGEVTVNTPATQTVSASGVGTPLVVIGAFAALDPLGTTALSPAADGTISNSGDQRMLYKIYSANPANVSASMDDAGSNVMQSFYLRVT